MNGSILVVDEDDERRRTIASSLAARGVRYLDVGDAFAGMAALGRADFGCVLALEGRRTLSLRGLCQLARKRHPDIEIFVTPKPGSEEEHVRSVLEMRFEILEMSASIERFVADLLTRIEAVREVTSPGQPAPQTNEDSGSDGGFGEFNPFEMPLTEDAAGVFDSIPRVDIPTLSTARGPSLKDASTLPPIPHTPAPLITTDAPGTTPTMIDLPVVPVELSEVAVAKDGGSQPEFREPTESTRPDARVPPSSSSSTQEAQLVVDGHFEDLEGGAGAAFLMSLFAQELTGRLVVEEGDAAGSMYAYRGEPVWADDPHGDAGLYRKLVQKLVLKPDFAVAPVGEGQLLGSLLQGGVLSSTQMHDFMREVVRDRVIAIALQKTGAYRFNEDNSFLDTAPLLKVNPFGIILESRRRSLSPPALLGLQSEIEDRFAVPGPGIAAADEKLTPFLRGAKASQVFDGQRTVKDLLASVGLDPFMGTLVVATLRDTRLVALETQARSAGMDLAERAFTDETSAELPMVDADLVDEGPTSAEEAKVREDIYSLYMRLKPLTQPRQVLGVGVDADEAAIEAAYASRMRELDPRRIPEGSAQHILAQRIEELRRKVASAYQTLKMQLSSSSPA